MLLEALFLTSSLSVVMTYHADRTNFLDRKKHTKIKNKVLDEYKKDKQYLDGVEHLKKNDLSDIDAKKVEDIENDFRRLVAMRGVKYLYKRDNMHWRTWRRLKTSDGDEKIVYYKCNNLLNKNSTDCSDCGLWTIEEPPCPLEYYSMIDKDWICVHNLSMKLDLEDNCPAKIKFLDLPITCDNPMETTWRFTSEFGAANDYKNVICNGRTYCEIFTTYLISPTNLTFRMINSESNIIYSRIMRANNTNYICVNGCGHYDPNRKKVTKLDTPTKLRLMSGRKNKRDLDGMEFESMVDSNLKKSISVSVKEITINKLFNIRGRKMAAKELQYQSFNISMKTTTVASNKMEKQQDVYDEYNLPDYLIL